MELEHSQDEKRSHTSTKFSLVKTVPEPVSLNILSMPGTTTANSSAKRSEVELVSERVTKTKKEIEQLKAQLQKLIDDGISKNDFLETKQTLASVSNESKTETQVDSVHNFNDKILKVDSEIDLNKAKTFKDNVNELLVAQLPTVHASVALRRKDKSPLKQVANEESPRKTRHYDQEAAREYIKKQREKRRELLKNKKQEVGFSQDIKKQRLQELREKSLQLVSKNIQHKRDRSKSKSREALDQLETKPTESSRRQVVQIPTKSRSREALDQHETKQMESSGRQVAQIPTKSRSREALDRHEAKQMESNGRQVAQISTKSRSQEALDQHETKQMESNRRQVAQIPTKFKAQVINKNLKVETDFVPNLIESKSELSMNFTHPQLQNITLRSNKRDLSAMPKLDIPKHIQFDIDSSSAGSSVHSLFPRQSHSTISKSQEHNFPANSTEITSPTVENNIKSLKFTQSARRNTLEEHKAALKIQTAFRGFRQRMLYKAALKMKQKVKEQATKEVQTTKIASDVPAWLQPPTAQPYPYNFLSAVKRKLNLAVQQPTRMTDAAVQNSLNEQKDTSDKTEKSSKQRSSNNKNTDLKSFLSHKCLDLDVKAIEPLALTRNVSLHDRKSSVHNAVPNSFLKTDSNGLASDSDTSKNIPEISSESSIVVTNRQHSSKRAHSSDTDHYDKPKINTDKIKKLKLLQPKRLNFSSEILKSPESSKQSSAKEISEHITGTNSSSRRKSKSWSNFNSVAQINSSRKDSIIASNKCIYSQDKTSQNPTEVRNPVLNQHKSLESSIKTESLIPPQDTLSSFRNYMNSLNTEKCGKSNEIIKSQVSSERIEKPDENSKSKEISSKPSDITSKPTEIPSKTSEIPSIPSEILSKTSEIASKTTEIASKASEMLDINKPHSEISESIIKTNGSSAKPHEYSSTFTSVPSTVLSSIPSLKRPNLSLKSTQRIPVFENAENVDDGKTVTTLILKPGETAALESRVKSNEIHLKFEAELHLLNEFNDSLRQIMAMDKSLTELRNNNMQSDKSTTTFHTRDTQTSFATKSSTETKIATESPHEVSEMPTQMDSKTQIEIPTINYSRGSEVSEHMDIFDLNNTIVETNNTTSLITTGLELSEIKENMLTSSNEESNVDISVTFAKENLYNRNNCTGLSLEMFEQLIKDEDARIENLKTILKIREKALVDRTKGELAWLEIQKKHLRDSGQLQEISAIKKKQRGLLIKLEHERHEMQRLKQMQKAASKERKSVLREQRNMIKAQLSNTSNIITKIKRNTKEERRHSGPLKVYNIKSHSESIRSETSMSRKSSVTEEIISVVSHSQSVISHVTEEAMIPHENVQQRSTDMAPASSNPQVKTEHVKRSLLMREVALQKRRKAAEELLQWHQRLIEEEEKIAELELAASAIINQVPTITSSMVSDEPTAEKHKFKGSQLNLLWHNMTGREEKKFNDHMTYSMSKISLERFCKDAKKHAISRNKSFSSKKSGKISDSDSSLSAIDVTVTELTHNKYRNTTNEKCKKLKSKSLHSSSEIASQIVIPRSKSNDSHQDYTSDFESVPSTNKSGLNTVSTDDEQKIWDETIIPLSQNNNSKISSVVESQSDKDIETVAEQLQSSRNMSTPSETNKSKITEENLLVNEISSIDVIDDNSTSPNNNINKVTASIPESFKNILNTADDINDISISVDKIIQSETNQDATSKDVSTDIEHDDKEDEVLETKSATDEIIKSLSLRKAIRSQNSITNISSECITSSDVESEDKESEILETKSANDNIRETDEVIKSLNLGTDIKSQNSITNISSDYITSADVETHEKESEMLETKSTNDNIKETDEVIKSLNLETEIKSQNSITSISSDYITSADVEPDEKVSEILETKSANDNIKATDKIINSLSLATEIESQNSISSIPSESSISSSLASKSKDVEEDIIVTQNDQLLSSPSESQLTKTDNQNQLTDVANDDQITEIDEDEMLNEENNLLIKSDPWVQSKENSHKLSNSRENQLISEANDITPTQSKTNEVIPTASETLLKSRKDNEEGPSRKAKLLTKPEILELSSHISVESSLDKENYNRITVDKPNRLKIHESENKTAENDDDTEIVSDEEWNQLSDISENQESIDKTHESESSGENQENIENHESESADNSQGSSDTKNVQEIVENSFEENEESIRTTTSISKKAESPLLLSYGFVDKKDKQTELEKSSLDEDNAQDTVEDISEQASLETNTNTESSVGEKTHISYKASDEDANKLSENHMKDEKLKNILHTSDDQLVDKSNISTSNDQFENKSDTSDDQLEDKSNFSASNVQLEHKSNISASEDQLEDRSNVSTSNDQLEDKSNISAFNDQLEDKSNISAFNDQLEDKSNISASNDQLEGKSNISASNDQFEGKSNISASNDQLEGKSNISAFNDQLEDKSNISAFNDQLEDKSNISASNDQLEGKSNISASNDQLEGKSNISASNDQLEHKSNKSTFDDQLEDKLNINASNDQLELKSNKSTFDDQLEDKLKMNASNDQLEDKSNISTFDDQLEHKSNASTFDDQLEDISSNINTSANQFEPENNLNQTYEVPLEETTEQKVDVKEGNEETRSRHDEKKGATDLEYIDVKKRVSEILADANIPSPRGDKSPRLQDLYVTAYDVVSPENSSTSGSPTEDLEQTFMPPRLIYGSDEVEELLKKQLEIEQEIKEIQQQQQKEHIPYLYVREIPNKPPPPYTPPVTIQTPVSGSVLPATEKQIEIVARTAADTLHKAYLAKNLHSASLSAEDKKILQSRRNIDKNCSDFIFDLCKEAAIDHYRQFEPETGPPWMHLAKRSKLAIGKPLDKNDLESFISTKVKQWLGYEIVKSTENIKRKWSGRKRDHVDELLVVECQAEEKEWTNYDRDELIVKDELTKDIMNMLLSESAQVFNSIFNKKTFLY